MLSEHRARDGIHLNNYMKKYFVTIKLWRKEASEKLI